MEKENKLILINQTDLTVTGIKKALTVSETQINLELDSTSLSIFGEDMEVKKLDIDSGMLEVNGLIISLKYLHKREKVGFIRRIFK